MKTQNLDGMAFAAIMDRIQRITNTRTQVELANVLGIRQSSISDAKRRRSIPADWLLKLYWTKRANPEWVVAGKGKQYLQSVDAEDVSLAVDEKHQCLSAGCPVHELVNELMCRVATSGSVLLKK